MLIVALKREWGVQHIRSFLYPTHNQKCCAVFISQFKVTKDVIAVFSKKPKCVMSSGPIGKWLVVRRRPPPFFGLAGQNNLAPSTEHLEAHVSATRQEFEATCIMFLCPQESEVFKSHFVATKDVLTVFSNKPKCEMSSGPIGKCLVVRRRAVPLFGQAEQNNVV